MDLSLLIAQCAPDIAPTTAHAVVMVESAGNPHSIGVVGGRLVRQPRNSDEAIATVNALEAGGWNYDVGLAQINRKNFVRLGLTTATAFEPCTDRKSVV